MFFNRFKDGVIPTVKKYRKETNQTGKILILDNAPTHPNVDVLNQTDDTFKVNLTLQM